MAALFLCLILSEMGIMLARICGRCGKKLKLNEVCECQKNRHKSYDRYQRNKSSAGIYHSLMWKKLTAECKEKCHDLDLYALHVKHKIVKGTLSHHIVELTDNRSRAYDQSNLIYLSDKSHAEVHAAYEKSVEDKKKMQGILFEILRIARG